MISEITFIDNKKISWKQLFLVKYSGVPKNKAAIVNL